MTIDIVYEVSCDGCSECTEQHADYSTKADLWTYLYERGWRRRKELLWCPACVEQGVFARKHIDWRD